MDRHVSIEKYNMLWFKGIATWVLGLRPGAPFRRPGNPAIRKRYTIEAAEGRPNKRDFIWTDWRYAIAFESDVSRRRFFLITNSMLTLLAMTPGIFEYSRVRTDPPDTRQPAC